MFREVSELLFEQVDQTKLPEIADHFLKEAGDCKVWVFSGEMGAGKTTLIKALCRKLGVNDTMSSPTFSIINEYETGLGRVFHFDFFRIKNEAEAYDIGADEYFYSGDYCFVEWPEKIPGLIPDAHVHVNIYLESQTLRTIALSVHDGKEKNRI
jgi:tRNA threonylcarbamoyladenosine biosynthesis protein TsaE